ncbi:HAMP domain-containing sensor histidine kinase [Halobellus sp. H-GB7]|uniref:sensor histidine kinase n=1 Tax=Halobellus sp. H-GB7 TaxID=3069756 RepID=UPI0027B68761|nr:HAMP domain-containing sensor histidine kinase [Halobellus sp. H-GB7]MDQ2054189.1 HAMP domain-containing sensor histidine kinase [Halobellus sp. H-GB7]
MDGLGEEADGRSEFEFSRETDASHQIELYDLILDISTSLMSAEPDELETKLRWGLESVGRHIGADRGYVFQAQNGGFERTTGWTDEGVVPWSAQRLDLEEFEWLHRRLERFDNTVVRTNELPRGTHLYELLSSEGVASAVFLPMVDNWSLEGFVGFDVVESNRQWDDTEVNLLRTVADMITHSLGRVRREQTLEAQNERLETFAGVISHDLRNPLNVVTGSLRLAQRDLDSPHVDRAARAADRMEGLIEQVLMLATQGQDISDPRPVRLESVVESAWDTNDTRAAELRIEDGLGTVDGDPDRLREAFGNLFRNAVEHGGDDVRVRVGPCAEGFYVADDGPGIPEDARESVFDRGYTTGGTGLGLAIVRTIVEAHGWSVRVRESADGGARFEITGVGCGRASD